MVETYDPREHAVVIDRDGLRYTVGPACDIDMQDGDALWAQSELGRPVVSRQHAEAVLAVKRILGGHIVADPGAPWGRK